MLVTLSGPDGVGKSTVASLISMELRSQHRRVVVLWHRPGYSDLLNRLRSTVRRVRPSAAPTHEDVVARQEIFNRRWVRLSWLYLAVFDSVLIWVVYTRFLLLIRRDVLCDRYVDDGILDLDLKFPDLHVRARRSTRLLRRLAPVPDYSVVLQAPPDVLAERWRLKVEPFPDSPEIRTHRAKYYERQANKFGVVVIDTNRHLDQIIEHIARLLREPQNARRAEG